MPTILPVYTILTSLHLPSFEHNSDRLDTAVSSYSTDRLCALIFAIFPFSENNGAYTKEWQICNTQIQCTRLFPLTFRSLFGLGAGLGGPLGGWVNDSFGWLVTQAFDFFHITSSYQSLGELLSSYRSAFSIARYLKHCSHSTIRYPS